MTGPLINRRQHERFQPLEYELFLGRKGGILHRLLGRRQENVGVEVGDLSESGVRIGVRDHMPVRTKVVVRCRFTTLNDQLDLEGEIVWCVPHSYREQEFMAGITFTNADAAIQRKIAAIRSYVNSPGFRMKHETRVRKRPPSSKRLEFEK